MQNTLYSVGRLPFLIDTASGLRDRLGWEPKYWITQPDLHEKVGAAFPQAVRHPFQDANRGIAAPEFGGCAGSAVEPALLDRTGQLFYAALRIVDRHVLADSLAREDRRNFLYRQLGYCLKVVDALQLRRFILNSTPHSVIDICFYIACRLRGAEIRMLHLTGFGGRQVILGNAEGSPLGLETTLKRWAADPDRQAPLSEEGERELNALRDVSQQSDPWYVSQQRDKETKFHHLYEAADFLLDNGLVKEEAVDLSRPLEIAEESLNGRKIGIPGSRPGHINIFSRRFAPKHAEPMLRSFVRPRANFGDPSITWREYYTYKDRALLQKRALQRRYEALTAAFDEERLSQENYVYFPLHYQPERTTCPEGGWFNDQFLAASILANALPKGWTLFIKEHPSQFMWQTEGELGRTANYYEPFLSLKNICFAPLGLSSHRLMTSARAVATITGMAGWEACARGCPVIVLGEPWYAQCDGVFRVRSVNDATTVFARIENGERPKFDRTQGFAAAIESIGRQCYMNPSHAPLYPGLSDEDNCAALVELFAESEAFVGNGIEGGS